MTDKPVKPWPYLSDSVWEWLDVERPRQALPRGAWVRYAGRPDWHHVSAMRAMIFRRTMHEGDVLVEVH